MHAETFFFAMFLGSMIGSIITISIQYYGRRKVRHALKADGLLPDRAATLLVNDNEAMRGQMSRLEERLSVMERITTDSHMNLSNEIERLR
jgi:hypothetical protein